jgi:hypothetical protein
MEKFFLMDLASYYEKQDATTRECLFALKAIILTIDANIVHKRKYQIPFFSYKDFNLGFLWVCRKKILVGFVVDRKTFSQCTAGRTKDYVTTMEINPKEDIPIIEIQRKFKEQIRKYDLS